LTIAHVANAPFLVVHVMSNRAAKMIKKAKSMGWNVYGETIAAALGADGSKYFSSD